MAERKANAARTKTPWLVAMLAIASLLLSACAVGPERSITTEAGSRRAQVGPLTQAQQAQFQTAQQAATEGLWEIAERELHRLIQARPDIGGLRSRLAWVWQQQGQPERALPLYQEALALAPDDVLAVNNLALLFQQQGDFERAAEVLRMGIERTPNVAELHFNFAVLCELYLLDLPTALEHYRLFQQMAEVEDPQVSGWIADLERRVH
ncbi:tetratricopeptide repeat protein [Marinobacter sp. SS21]|uniref:tetratricopeptide repeat protein n=1 Tax=Marinobacter sp. SS21 TaxID=2979460 RepID=UPI00232EB8FF|nr:tetratricopeptide repeat protein [Marinobacter sp. SS21]MDC0661914.1 tetratricopeptide repeat protein [Marinobacter sp. SS21]